MPLLLLLLLLLPCHSPHPELDVIIAAEGVLLCGAAERQRRHRQTVRQERMSQRLATDGDLTPPLLLAARLWPLLSSECPPPCVSA